MKPADYKKRILLCVTGRSPAIITEVLYALVTQDGFVPNEIQIITTKQGKEDISVLFKENSPFHELCKQLRLNEPIRFDEKCINVISKGKIELDDIRTAADNDAAANSIVDTVRTLCQENDSAIHISMAGGRKTMGFYMAYALSLFGRPQDQLSHVLVSNEFERCPKFYFPSQLQQEVKDNNGNIYIAKNAKIELAKIPLVLLREKLDKKLLKKKSYTDLVFLAQRSLSIPKTLSFDVKNHIAYFDNIVVEMNEVPFATLMWLAARKKKGLPGVCTYEDKNGNFYLEFLFYLEQIENNLINNKNNKTEENEKLRKYMIARKEQIANKNKNESVINKHGTGIPVRNKNVEFLEGIYPSHRKEINDYFRKDFPIVSRGKKPGVTHELDIPEEGITFPDKFEFYEGSTKTKYLDELKERIMKRVEFENFNRSVLCSILESNYDK